MPDTPRIVELELPSDEDELAVVLQRSCIKTFHSVDRVGLPAREWVQRVDQKIMGDVATDALATWISRELELDAILYDDVRCDGCELRDPGWDIGLADDGIPDPVSWEGPWCPPPAICTISVKSSRVPAKDGDVPTAVSRRDFKILAYSQSIFEDLNADIEAQVYYDMQSWPSAQSVNREEIERATTDLAMAREIGKRLDVRARFGRPFFVGFASADALVNFSNGLPRPKRTFLMPGLQKRFWTAPLSNLARAPRELQSSPPQIKRSIRPRPIEPQANS